MNMHVTEMENGITRIELDGRLDIAGAGQIETQFTGRCAGEGRRILVDLSGVEFLASIGIRLLVSNAKSLNARKGRMTLLNPAPAVMSALEITDIPAIIPVYSRLESAEAVLLAS